MRLWRIFTYIDLISVHTQWPCLLITCWYCMNILLHLICKVLNVWWNLPKQTDGWLKYTWFYQIQVKSVFGLNILIAVRFGSSSVTVLLRSDPTSNAHACSDLTHDFVNHIFSLYFKLLTHVRWFMCSLCWKAALLVPMTTGVIVFWCVHRIMLMLVINKKWHHLLSPWASAHFVQAMSTSVIVLWMVIQ